MMALAMRGGPARAIQELWRVAQRKLKLLDAAARLEDLAAYAEVCRAFREGYAPPVTDAFRSMWHA
jgi:plasmid maintenance system killer protein